MKYLALSVSTFIIIIDIIVYDLLQIITSVQTIDRNLRVCLLLP